MDKLYLIFAFDDEETTNLFANTLDFDLAKEMQLMAINWGEWTLEGVKQTLGTHFENEFCYFVFCEIEFNDIRPVKLRNDKMSAG